MPHRERGSRLADIRNPFRGDIFRDPWREAEVDVPEIHGEAFRDLLDGVREVREAGRTETVLLHGAAGSGKTHLLSRFRHEVTRQVAERPAIFISVQLNTAPSMLWRHVQKRVADDLLRPIDGARTQFSDMLPGRLSELDEGQLAAMQIDLDLLRALECLAEGRHRRQARALLRGDSLTEVDLEQMGLPIPDPSVEQDPEDRAERVVLGLCRLLDQGCVFVPCFDQVEALRTRADDMWGLFRFGKLISSLYHSTTNVLAVSCIQSVFVDSLREATDSADRDRLATFQEASLHLLDAGLATKLAVARMDARGPLDQLRREHAAQPLWPLDADEFRRSIEAETGHRMTARKVLSLCRHLFDQAKLTPIVCPVDRDAFLAEAWQERVEESIQCTDRADADAVLAHGIPLLMTVADNGWRQDTQRDVRDIDVSLLDSNGRRLDISFCNQAHMTSLAARLRRLMQCVIADQLGDLVLLRHPNSPISRTARATRDRLKVLANRGVPLFHPSAEVLAALDAMRGLLSDAHAGDLANDAETIGPRAVEQWLRGNLPGCLSGLLAQLTNPAEDRSAEPDGLLDLLAEEHIVRLGDAASTIGCDPDAVATWVQQNPSLVGLLQGPPSVLFQMVPNAATEINGEVV